MSAGANPTVGIVISVIFICLIGTTIFIVHSKWDRLKEQLQHGEYEVNAVIEDHLDDQDYEAKKPTTSFPWHYEITDTEV